MVLLGAPDAFAVIPGTLAKSMYPVKRIERLCDNFSTISPDWQPKGRDGKDNWFGLWGQTLSISGVEGQVMARPFEEDNCSVQVKISTNGSFWDGGPTLLLYWKKGYYAGINAGGMRPIPNGPKICCSAVVDGKSVGTGIGPVAESTTWVKITLLPETLEFFYSADAKTWSKLQSIPRKGLEGAPSMLLIGTPMPNSEYCAGKGRGDGTVFFGDLVTGRD